MITDYPDSVSGVQIHQTSWTPWGNDRRIFYSAYSIPVAWFDGVDKMLGSSGNDDEDYAELVSYMNVRLAVPTDVTIELVADELSEGTYMVTARIGVEEGGQARTVRVHIVDTLWDWPEGYPDGRYSYCVRQGFDMGERDLVPGETIEVQQEITFKSESWARPEDIQIVAFVQEPEDGWPAEVHQSATLTWPFPTECPGDVNSDAVVDIDDVFAVLAAWGTCSDCPEDVNEDGNVDIDDLFAVLAGWGPC